MTPNRVKPVYMVNRKNKEISRIELSLNPAMIESAEKFSPLIRNLFFTKLVIINKMRHTNADMPAISEICGARGTVASETKYRIMAR